MQRLQLNEDGAEGEVEEAPDPEDTAAQVSCAHLHLHPAASFTERVSALHESTALSGHC